VTSVRSRPTAQLRVFSCAEVLTLPAPHSSRRGTQARDANGNAVRTGGAQLSAAFVDGDDTNGGGGGGAVTVADRGHGQYDVTYTRHAAGAFTLMLSLPTQGTAAVNADGADVDDEIEIDAKNDATTLRVAVTCVPGPTDPERCVVRLLRPDGTLASDDAGGDEWEATAGECAVLAVRRFDAFGNAVTVADAPLRAAAAGPGAMLTEVLEKAGGEVHVRCHARNAGTYRVAVTDATSVS